MILECPECGSDNLLTERRLNGESKCRNCGYRDSTFRFVVRDTEIPNYMELKQKIDKLTTQLVSYEATIEFLKDALHDIANEDYRGNRSSGSVKAYNALKRIDK